VQDARAEIAAIDLSTPDIPAKMGQIIPEVALTEVSTEVAFEWWSQTTDIPLVVNWRALEEGGVDRDQPVNLQLDNVPARQLLSILMQQASNEFAELIYDQTPWYVQVTTKREANRHPVLRVYDVADLVTTVPNFTDPPTMNLEDVLSTDVTGGGGSATSIVAEADEEEDLPTEAEQGQAIADMIRATIEPTIWQANGGDFSSVRYFDRRLIVNAPEYVHRQIGIPTRPAPVPRISRSPYDDAPAPQNDGFISDRQRRSRNGGVR
jgi:hypothetical protein